MTDAAKRHLRIALAVAMGGACLFGERGFLAYRYADWNAVPDGTGAGGHRASSHAHELRRRGTADRSAGLLLI